MIKLFWLLSMTTINPKRLDYYICHLREKYYEASRNKAILSFRYDSLEMKANITQVTIILLSTIVTFLESLKAYYHLDFKIINIVRIVMNFRFQLSVYFPFQWLNCFSFFFSNPVIKWCLLFQNLCHTWLPFVVRFPLFTDIV